MLKEKLLLLCLILTNCGNMPQAKKIFFCPKQTILYKYEISEERLIDQIVSGNKHSAQLYNACVLTYNFFGKKNGEFEVNAIIDSFKLGKESKEYNGLSPLEKTFFLLPETTFKLSIANNGSVLSITNIKDFQNKIDRFYGTVAKKDYSLSPPSKTSFSNGALKQIFEKPLGILPENGGSMGVCWTKNEIFQGLEPIHLKVTYSIRSIEDDKVIVHFFSDFQNSVSIAGLNAIEITGQLQGNLQLERETGMLLTSESFLILKGETKNANSNFPIEVKTKTQINRIN